MCTALPSFYRSIIIGSLGLIFLLGCQSSSDSGFSATSNKEKIRPLYITEKTAYDTDDPAIWIHPTHPEKSLILGTDKDEKGGLYVFDLKGRIIEEKVVRNIRRPNNVDVEYGLAWGDTSIDIAVLTERLDQKLRVFRLPDMKPMDGGGLEVFEGEQEGEYRAPMGIALYKTPGSGDIYAFVSRKNGPQEDYIWQYRLSKGKEGSIEMAHVRSLGKFSGQKEIEALAVDDALGYLYYSDESRGVRQYFASPDSGKDEIALFAREGFADDREGISIFPTGEKSGYLLVSDQEANEFHVYDREHASRALLAVLTLSTQASDGSESCARALSPDFPQGLFVAMSDDRTFQLYSWEVLEKEIKKQQNLALRKEE